MPPPPPPFFIMGDQRVISCLVFGSNIEFRIMPKHFTLALSDSIIFRTWFGVICK